MSGHLEPAELQAILDGVGDPGQAARLDASSREQLEAARAAAAFLQAAAPASRAWCPPRETLLLAAAELAPAEAARRERHVAACPACRSDLADFRALELGEWAPARRPAPARHLLQLVIDSAGKALRWLEGTFEPLPGPAPALARGEPSATATQRAELELSEGGVLSLTWGLGPEAGRLDLALAGPERFRVDLGLGEEVWESRTAEAGQALLRGLAQGVYRIRVYGAGATTPGLDLTLELASESGAHEGT